MPEPSPDLRDLIALQLVPGLGPRLTAALLEHFGSARAVLEAPADTLRQVPYVGPKLAAAVADPELPAKVDAELKLLEEHNVRLRVLGTPDYPAALAQTPDPPHLLYVRGTLLPPDANAVGVVGTRRPTAYGRRVAERLASGLARAGYVIVSGLAHGVDAIAHRAALQAGGRTLAVLAGGLTRIYPRENLELARDVENAGALLTESSMRQGPMAGLFPARNRIISGLSKAVVIVEAAQRSGALITATHAAEQGRPVLAVPGPVDSDQSGGCHDLIRKGAVLCRGVDDVLEELNGLPFAPPVEEPSPPPMPAQPPPPALDPTQRLVWDFLAERPRALDEMAQHLRMSVPQLSGLLLTLEMKRAVRRLPGNRYERC